MSSIARPLARGLPWGWVVALVSVAVISAAGSWAWAQRSADDGVGAARTATERAVAAQAAVADLSADVERLEQRLAAITRDGDRSAERLGRVKESLWASLGRVRSDLAAARSGSKEALASVGSAVAEAQAAARKLSVLEDRFEYHLRADHGGG